jgi:hypothetical protein
MQIPFMIDLHGYTIEKGFHKTLMFMKIHKMNGSKSCRIITGRSGKMNKEFKDWMNHPSFKTLFRSFYQDFHKGSWTVHF